jgi:hypothetical protein
LKLEKNKKNRELKGSTDLWKNMVVLGFRVDSIFGTYTENKEKFILESSMGFL